MIMTVIINEEILDKPIKVLRTSLFSLAAGIFPDKIGGGGGGP